jgi:hypothetical protein
MLGQRPFRGLLTPRCGDEEGGISRGGATKTDKLHSHRTLLTGSKVASSPDLGSLGLCGGFSVGELSLQFWLKILTLDCELE